MDRFIDYNNLLPQITEQIFKIQYGQIYSLILRQQVFTMKNLKSNMDRFIEELEQNQEQQKDI